MREALSNTEEREAAMTQLRTVPGEYALVYVENGSRGEAIVQVGRRRARVLDRDAPTLRAMTRCGAWRCARPAMRPGRSAGRRCCCARMSGWRAQAIAELELAA